MSKTFFISDTHYDDKSKLNFDFGLYRSKFKHVELINQVLIERWNDTVGDDDTVYHLGDLTIGLSKIPTKSSDFN